MKRIKNDIDNKTFGRVYLLYGPESYLRLHYIFTIRSVFVMQSFRKPTQ